MNLANSFRKQKQAQIPLQIRLPMREAGFERYVGQVRALLGVNEAVIFDYLELLENAGLRIVFLPLGEKIKSLSCYDRANANAFLFVNSEGLSLERQLFRLSYELGRVYLYNGGMQGAMKIGTLDAEHAARRFVPNADFIRNSKLQQVGTTCWTS